MRTCSLAAMIISAADRGGTPGMVLGLMNRNWRGFPRAFTRDARKENVRVIGNTSGNDVGIIVRRVVYLAIIS